MDLYSDLKILLESKSNKEDECRAYLTHIKEFMMKGKFERIIYENTELPLTSGKIDYIISGSRIESGIEREIVYLWELKAPQCSIFQRDTNNRLKPTKELISAENQLLHYYLDLKRSSDLRQVVGVPQESSVEIGGIIMSTNERKVSSRYKKDIKEQLYRRAIDTRKILYKNSKCLICTWDEILNQFKPLVAEDEQKTSESEGEKRISYPSKKYSIDEIAQILNELE